MNLQIFKEKLNKGQLEAMAIDTVKKQLESVDALEALEFAKKLKFFSDVLIKESESKAMDVWEQLKQNYPNMTYTNGGDTYSFDHWDYFNEIESHEKNIKNKMVESLKSKEPVFISNIITGEIMDVPKAKIKGGRKDSINVKI